MANKVQAVTSPVTFDVNDPVFQQIVAQAVAVRLAAIEAEKPVKNTLVDGRTEGQLKLDVLVARSFKKAGYGEVKPRQDVMTYNRWLAAGYRVRPGEKATKVRQFRLFHKSQVEFVGQPDKAEQRAEGEAAVAKATVTQMKPTKGRGRGKAKASSADQPTLGV